MALSNKSSFLYGYQINQFNSSLDFQTTNSGPILQATLRFGFYSLSALLREVARALTAADPDNEFSTSADRTMDGGLENRTIITTTTATYFALRFFSGPRAASSCSTILGFNLADRTGSLTYTSDFTSGTLMVPTMVGYNYLQPDFNQKQFGTVNISASGVKEAIVFQTQQFVMVTFKYEPYAKVLSDWSPFMQWASKQRLFEFMPDITNPSVIYEVTMETTSADGKGLAYKFSEMLPDFPNLYQTGALMMRINEV